MKVREPDDRKVPLLLCGLYSPAQRWLSRRRYPDRLNSSDFRFFDSTAERGESEKASLLFRGK